MIEGVVGYHVVVVIGSGSRHSCEHGWIEPPRPLVTAVPLIFHMLDPVETKRTGVSPLIPAKMSKEQAHCASPRAQGS